MNFIQKKNEFHTEKESILFTENSLEEIKTCKFELIDEMNRTFGLLIGRMSSKLEID
jgi:hypothetical protein